MGLVREKRYGKIRIFEALFETLTISFGRDGSVGMEATSAVRFDPRRTRSE
jgi:hypothetical protein